MSRYKCAICGRTRDEKFMKAIYYKFKLISNLNGSHYCDHEIKFRNESDCKQQIIKTIEKDIKLLNSQFEHFKEIV